MIIGTCQINTAVSAAVGVEVNPLDVRTVGCADRYHHTSRGWEEANLGISTLLEVAKQSMSPREVEVVEDKY